MKLTKKGKKIRRKIIAILIIPLTLVGVLTPVFIWLISDKSFMQLFRFYNLTGRYWSEDYDAKACLEFDIEDEDDYKV